MRTEILNNLDNPKLLEKLYRADKPTFRKEFNILFPEIQEQATARVWNERLNFENEETSWGTSSELMFVVAASFVAGFIAKIPDLSSINNEFYYTRNLSFIVLPVLTLYFAWKQNIEIKKRLIALSVFLISCMYINLLPGYNKSDTVILACIHLPIFLWAVLGYAFTGGEPGNLEKRLDFLRYNGDVIVMTTLILIAGGLLSAITFGLFELINMHIQTFYFKYVVVWGLPASPVVGTYLVRNNPQLVNRISPVIAKIFTPLVLLMLLIYLAAVIYTGKDPYNDRNFLLVFNLLLIGVMALIHFSIIETAKNSSGRLQSILLFALSIITIVINGIALSAILFRISTWGITPNRLVVLIGNILIVTNLFIVSYRLLQTINDRTKTWMVEKSIASFLPVYIVWAMLVVFVFPVLFGFK